MNEELTAWFHCGRCASLFRSVAGEAALRRCTSCGGDPSLGLEPEAVPGAPVKSEARDPMLRVRMAEVEKPKFYKREVKRQKGRYFVMKLVLVWAVLMAVLAVSAKFLWMGAPRATGDHIAERAGNTSLADRDRALLERSYRDCLMAMSGFLTAGTPEAKNQFVRTPVETAGRMARFYQMNPMHTFEASEVRGTGSGVIELADGRRLVETRWTVADGRSLDAVFFEERGEWKLDWEEFVRYGDEPWTLFLSGKGDAEGEFRLFARERMGGERSGVGSLRIILHAPRFGHPSEFGDPTPEIMVEQLSPEGRLLIEAFKKLDDGGRIYGSTLESRDPPGMVRVRVKVRRTDGIDGPEFRISEIKACHWLSVDDPGVAK